MKALILAAGYATRLYPLTENQPKPLLPVGNKPILEWILERVVKIKGVDGVFIGPADLSASMGHVGNPNHPDVQAAIDDAILRIVRAGKAPGILTSDEAQARHYLALGAVFVAVGLDTALLAQQTRTLAACFKEAV